MRSLAAFVVIVATFAAACDPAPSKPPEAPTATVAPVASGAETTPSSSPPADPTPLKKPEGAESTKTADDNNGPTSPTSVSPPPTAPPSPSSNAPFDRGAAAHALGAVNVQSCKRPNGVTGIGHVTVTFAPSGMVASAVVDSGPFPGTSEGGCIAVLYRNIHVPPYSGPPVRVGKSFSLN